MAPLCFASKILSHSPDFLALYENNLSHLVARELADDCPKGDLTGALLGGAPACFSLFNRESALLCGADSLALILALLSKKDKRATTVRAQWHHFEGEWVERDSKILTIEGPDDLLLRLERSFLNILQTLSGTATLARRCGAWVEGTMTRLLDTRKTLPAMRYAQKYAVRLGGLQNHRLSLSDAFLIKENHIAFAGGIRPLLDSIATLPAYHEGLEVVVEVERLSQIEEVLACRSVVSRVMLDNFTLADTKAALSLVGGQIPLESSGVPFAKDAVRALSGLGVDYISFGALTKHLHATDFSMRYAG